METLTPRQIKKRITKQHAEVEAQITQKPVKELKINIEWARSRTWGWNPKAEVWVTYQDGSGDYAKGFTASGCGYDKESTVIADIFNKFLRYKLYQPHKYNGIHNGEPTKHPYGVYYYDGHIGEIRETYISKPSYNGGVGTSCYYEIAKFIGGKFENIANGKAFGAFLYTDNQRGKK